MTKKEINTLINLLEDKIQEQKNFDNGKTENLQKIINKLKKLLKIWLLFGL